MKLNSIKNHQRPSSIDVKVLSEWSSWRWFLGNIFGFAFQKKMWLLGCHCTVLMLWVVQAAARYFVFFSNQRNRPPTQLSCLKGSCAPWWFWRGVDWGWLDPLNPSFGLLALAQVQCYREYRGGLLAYSISTLQCHEAVCPCLALMEDAEPFGCFHVNTFLMALAPLINISISTPCSSNPSIYGIAIHPSHLTQPNHLQSRLFTHPFKSPFTTFSTLGPANWIAAGYLYLGRHAPRCFWQWSSGDFISSTFGSFFVLWRPSFTPESIELMWLCVSDVDAGTCTMY